MLLPHVLLPILLSALPAPASQDAHPAPAPAVESIKDATYAELFKQFNTARAKWEMAFKAPGDARERGTAEELAQDLTVKLPHPAKRFFARFDELARGGDLNALRWCVQWGGYEELAPEERWQFKLGRLQQMIGLIAAAEVAAAAAAGDGKAGDPPAAYSMIDFVRTLPSMANDLDPELSCALCDDALARSSLKDQLAPQVYYTQAQILIRAAAMQTSLSAVKTPQPPPERALALLKRVASEFPEHDNAQRATGQIFKFERLQIGMVAPEVISKDVEDVEFKLSDYRGKVVVLDFWGFW